MKTVLIVIHRLVGWLVVVLDLAVPSTGQTSLSVHASQLS